MSFYDTQDLGYDSMGWRLAWRIGIGFTELTYELDGIFLIHENVLAH